METLSNVKFENEEILKGIKKCWEPSIFVILQFMKTKFPLGKTKKAFEGWMRL